jgi:hypothetical protein
MGDGQTQTDYHNHDQTTKTTTRPTQHKKIATVHQRLVVWQSRKDFERSRGLALEVEFPPVFTNLCKASQVVDG